MYWGLKMEYGPVAPQIFWSPFKWIGSKLNFLESKPARVFTIVPALAIGYVTAGDPANLEGIQQALPIVSMAIALTLILYAFASRKSAMVAWSYLLLSHFFIIAGILANTDHVIWDQAILYGSGALAASILWIHGSSKNLIHRPRHKT